MRIITLDNVREELEKGGVIQKERLYHPTNKWRKYKLLKDVNIKLSNNTVIVIPKDFEWDLSSTPRALWWLLPPDGDFEIAALVHDYLYRSLIYNRKFADKEMLLWSEATNNRKKWFIVDNHIRYAGCRAFGWIIYNRNQKNKE